MIYHKQSDKSINYNNQLPPHDKNAEQAVAGSLLLSGDIMTDLTTICSSKDFFFDQYRDIYNACEKIYARGEGINEITVSRQLQVDNKLKEIGGISFLSDLIANCPSPLQAMDYAKIVKHTAVLRQCISYSIAVFNSAYIEPDPNVVMQLAQKTLIDIQAELSMPRLATPKQVTEIGFARYADLLHGEQVSLKTGIYELDRLTGGMFNKEYWILGARPGIGKTTLQLQIINNIIKQNPKNNVLMVSLEQGKEEILDRRIASKTGLPIMIIRSGNYDKHNKELNRDLYDDIYKAMSEIPNENIYFYDSGSSLEHEEATVQSILSIANHMKLAYGLSAVFIDYLHLIGDEYGGNNEEQRVSYISRHIKKMARTLDVPVFVICQLNRRLETQTDRKPKLSDLRSSGSLEQDADVVVFLYRDDYYRDIVQFKKAEGQDIVGKAQLILAKQRQGLGVSEAEIDLLWNNSKQEYLNVVDSRYVPEEFR